MPPASTHLLTAPSGSFWAPSVMGLTSTSPPNTSGPSGRCPAGGLIDGGTAATPEILSRTVGGKSGPRGCACTREPDAIRTTARRQKPIANHHFHTALL